MIECIICGSEYKSSEFLIYGVAGRNRQGVCSRCLNSVDENEKKRMLDIFNNTPEFHELYDTPN